MKKKKVIGVAAICALMGLPGCDLVAPTSSCVHEWSPWEVEEESNCTERGSRVRYCYKCEKTQARTIAIDSSAHDWVPDKSADSESTCTTKGITGSQICSRCNTRKKGTEKDYSDHVWTRADTTGNPNYKEATCEEAGLYQNKCKNCETTEDVRVEPLKHLAGTPDKSRGDLGVVYCSRQGCGKLMAYQLDISDATGYNTPNVRMNAKSGDVKNKAVWDISSYVGTIIPAGAYDIQLEAAMTDSSHGNRKLYNMARKDLVVDGDLDGNVNGTPDSVSESAYRYFMKVDATTYYPSTKESFQDLGLTVGAANTRYFDFIQGVNINKETTTLSLIHGDIGYSLFIRSIRFIPHQHDDNTETFNGSADRVGYTLEKCSCGYRKITVDAIDGSHSEDLDASAPVGHVRLAANGDSISYKINVEESVTGSLYLVGRQAIGDLEHTPFNISVKNNSVDITDEWAGKKAKDFLGTEEDPALPGYTKEGRILLGEITLKDNVENGDNELVITRTGDYNIAVSQIVIEGRPTGHIHKFEHVASGDEAATCTKDKRERYECSCGQFELRPVENTKIDHEWKEDYHRDPTCTTTGKTIDVCTKCGTSRETEIPKSHDMATIDSEDTPYELKECTKCHEAREATWTLKQEMIQDKVGDEYVQTSAEAKTGKMSDGVSNMSVFKFDTANRRVVLTYDCNATSAVDAKLSILATTKASNIESCQPYQQSIGEDPAKKKLEVTVNGGDPIGYSAAQKAKTIADMGLKSTPSNVDDGGKLSDPVWFEYVNIELNPGNNTIIIEVPVKSQFSMYIGGFRITH